MPGLTMRRGFVTIAASMLTAMLSVTADAQIRFDLPAQPLAHALTKVGNLAKLNILFDSPVIDGLQASSLKGELSVDDALARLLAGTRLHAVRVNEKTFSIVDEATLSRAKNMRDPSIGAAYSLAAMHLAFAGDISDALDGNGVGQSSFASDSNRTGDDAEGGVARPSNGKNQQPSALEEIVVTAEKRNERLQDVPVPVTVISADSLVESNKSRLEDYYNEVPGLSLTPADFRGLPILTIRGVTTGGFSNPTVGVMVDEVPYGSSSSTGGGAWAPDIDPSDLQRVEVLRGPQGTLYGASSLGGLLKFVTVDPSTESLSGRIQADVNSVRNGDGPGYGIRGAVNAPVNDTMAVRASVFTRRDPGYIDDPVLHIRGVNWADAYGGRLAGLWRPTDLTTLKVSALFQSSQLHGSPDVDVEPGLGDLQQSRVRGTGGYKKQVSAFSATLTTKLGGVDLTSVSGYNINTVSDSADFTPLIGASTADQFGVFGTPLVENNKTKKFTQEIRLSSQAGGRFDWLLGAFYTHEDTQYNTQILAADSFTGVVVGQWNSDDFPSTYSEYAAFADLTVHLTDQFDIQIGGRESRNKQSYSETIIGPYDPVFLLLPSPVIQPEISTQDNSFTYLVTPRFKISPDLMVYARLASGYRPGGPNLTSTVFGVPAAFKPDKTQNYEVGFKGDLLDRRLSFDTSVYYIDWKDIQLSVTDPLTGSGYYANGGRAKSQGAEFSVVSRPLQGLSVSAWVAWNDAKLTESFPATSSAFGESGDRLPYSSRYSASVSLDKEFALNGDLSAFFGGTVSYVGNREGVFASIFAASPERQDLPGYTKTDLRAGLRRNAWAANFFVNNVTDKRGVLTGGLGTINPDAFTYIQPRAFGLSLSKKF